MGVGSRGVGIAGGSGVGRGLGVGVCLGMVGKGSDPSGGNESLESIGY
jgi:hypothetical protein